MGQHSVNRIHVLAQKGHQQALQRNIQESKLCYYYICVFSVISHLYMIHFQLLILSKLLTVVAKFFHYCVLR